MKTILRIFRALFIMGVFCFLALIGVGVGLYYYFSKELPKLDTLRDYSPPVISEVYDTHGVKIGEFWNEKRIVLKPGEMPKVVVQAIISSEDDRFFEHGGIDPQGIIRAFFENLRAGHTVQGGSTITQQVVKSLLLTPERSYTRKIKEAILATRLEKNFTKDEILNLYLNQIYLGNRAYGIEAAARNYFHKSAKELSIAEAAMIAGLAKAPTSYSPLKSPSSAKTRQDYVIERMREEGYITKEQADAAKTTPLTVFREDTDKDYNYEYAPWYTEHIRRLLQEKYGETAPYAGGLRIDAAVDLNMQRAADAAVNRGLRELDKREGYGGPIRSLSLEQIPVFSDENHIKIIDANTRSIEVLSPKTREQKLTQPTPLETGKYYEGVITALDRTAQNLEVQVGHVKGTIRVHDYTWARKRNLNSAGYDNTYYVKDPHGTFAVGDVIYVKLKSAEQLADKNKGYVAGQVYFSLEQLPGVEGAIFSFEPSTGYVRAMVGGKDFRQSEFNRAIQALRQTGSAIKPLVYAAALDKGYTVSSIIDDSPLSYEYSPGRFWTPKNYGGGYSGPTTFRNALVNSKNIVTVRILMDIGTDYVAAYARKLGINSPMQRYYSMALGSNDLKLYELCRAYGSFLTGGILPDLVYIKRVTDRNGKVLEEYQPRAIKPYSEQLKSNKENGKGKKGEVGLRDDLWKEGEPWIAKDNLKLSDIEKKILYGNYIPEGYVMSPRTAYTMVQLMHDIVNFGTGYKVKAALKHPAGGKTGTTNDETDTWFVGFTPDLFAGVWVGFDQIQKIGSRETGGNTSAPIFIYYMQEVLKDKPIGKFVIPEDINAEALKAPIDTSVGDAEAGGIEGNSGADFFIQDF